MPAVIFSAPLVVVNMVRRVVVLELTARVVSLSASDLYLTGRWWSAH